MSDEKFTGKEKFIKEMFSLFFDEKNNDFFMEKDLSNVKAIIADKYFDESEIIIKISEDEKLRLKYGSSKLVSNIIIDFSRKIEEESQLAYFIQRISCLNHFEDKFFDDNTIYSSIPIITDLLKKYQPEYDSLSSTEKEKKAQFDTFFDILFSLFKKIVIKVKITDQSRGGPFVSLYTQVKRSFFANNFKNAEIFFKYFFFFLENIKGTINLADVNSGINQFLGSSINNANRIITSIKSVESAEDFFKRIHFKDQILNRAKSEESFIETFYNCFDDKDKISLLTHWLQFDAGRSLDSFKNILEKIEYSVPNADDFGNTILQAVDKLSTNSQKEEILEVFFRLKLSDDYDYSTYSSKIISYLCSTNLDLHNLGLSQLISHKGHIKSVELKNKFENFMENSVMQNFAQHYQHFKNILDRRTDIGIDKKFINQKIENNQTFLQSFTDRLLGGGDLELLKKLSPILSKSNYLLIAKAFFNTAGAHIRSNKNLIKNYKGIIDEFMNKYWSDLIAERKNFIENYRFNLSEEEDELISRIEK